MIIIRDLKDLASQAGVQAQDKHLTLFRVEDENDGQRPDLMLAGQGVNGRDLLLDITIGHPTCQSYVQSACRERGYTITKKNKAKNDKYKDKCEMQGACFLPLAFESFGLASKEVVTIISNLAQKAAELSGVPYACLLSYWKKRISTTLQIGTAKFIVEASSSCSRLSHSKQDLEDSAMLEARHVRQRH